MLLLAEDRRPHPLAESHGLRRCALGTVEVNSEATRDRQMVGLWKAGLAELKLGGSIQTPLVVELIEESNHHLHTPDKLSRKEAHTGSPKSLSVH